MSWVCRDLTTKILQIHGPFHSTLSGPWRNPPSHSVRRTNFDTHFYSNHRTHGRGLTFTVPSLRFLQVVPTVFLDLTTYDCLHFRSKSILYFSIPFFPVLKFTLWSLFKIINFHCITCVVVPWYFVPITLVLIHRIHNHYFVRGL